MEICSQSDAKKFFVDKIVTEASIQGITLSNAQFYMLSWSESDPNFEINTEMNAAFEQENTNHDYERMIHKFIKKAYERDIKTDKSLRDDWRKAYSTLKKGDHYIIVMLNDSLGSALVPWWKLTF